MRSIRDELVLQGPWFRDGYDRDFAARLLRDVERLTVPLPSSVRGPCWGWPRSLDENGYGRVSYRGKQMGPYRAMWLVWFPALPIPDGWSVDHMCMIRECINPMHLLPVPFEMNSALAQGRKRSGGYKRSFLEWVERNSDIFEDARDYSRRARAHMEYRNEWKTQTAQGWGL